MRLLAQDGNLHLTTVVNPGGAGFFPHVVEQEPQAKEQEALENLNLLARRYLPLDTEVSLHVLSGAPGKQLIALAAQLEADLLVLTSRGESSRWPLRRATIEHAAVCAPCSVLVLQENENGESEPH